MTARRLFAGLLAAAVAAVGLAAEPASAATPSAAVVVAPDGGGVVRADRDLGVTVAVTNRGTDRLPAGRVALSVDKAPTASTTTLLDSIAHPSQVLLGFLAEGATAAVPAVDPGATVSVRVRIDHDVLAGILGTASGARLLYARYRTEGVQTVAESAVVRMAGSFRGSVGFGTVVPLVAPANATGVVDTATQESLTEPGGAWDSALRAAEAAPWATVALDPEVIASVRLAGDAAPPAALDLLDRLERLPNQVVRLPYADGDVTLQRAAGRSRPLGPTSFSGTSVVPATGPDPAATPQPTATPGATATSVEDLTAWGWSDQSVMWPVPGTTTPADVASLTGLGSTLLLSSSDVKDTPARRAAGPSARLGSGRALIADAAASSLLATASGRGPAADAALAQLVGVLATEAVTAESPSVLTTIGRSADAAALGRALSLLDGQSWIAGRSLAELATTPPAAALQLQPRSVPAARVTTARNLLDGERSVRDLGTAITAGGASVTGPQRLALLGTLSAAWRRDDAGWAAAASAVEQGFAGLGTAISIPRQSTGSNAIGTDGRLQVFVKNELDVPVEVVVHAQVSNGRLQFTGKGVAIAVPANATNKGQLAFRSITNGATKVTLSLTTPSGAPIGRTAERNVQVSAGFDTIVAVVLLGALGLLLALGVYRNITRRRQPRAAAA